MGMVEPPLFFADSKDKGRFEDDLSLTRVKQMATHDTSGWCGLHGQSGVALDAIRSYVE
jgi:hypothetical protein